MSVHTGLVTDGSLTKTSKKNNLPKHTDILKHLR